MLLAWLPPRLPRGLRRPNAGPHVTCFVCSLPFAMAAGLGPRVCAVVFQLASARLSGPCGGPGPRRCAPTHPGHTPGPTTGGRPCARFSSGGQCGFCPASSGQLALSRAASLLQAVVAHSQLVLRALAPSRGPPFAAKRGGSVAARSEIQWFLASVRSAAASGRYGALGCVVPCAFRPPRRCCCEVALRGGRAPAHRSRRCCSSRRLGRLFPMGPGAPVVS